MDTNNVLLFTDGSVNAQSKIGYGAMLAIAEDELGSSTLESNVRVKRFENTSSTKLELQTLLWALSEIDSSVSKISIHTDSQNIVGLPGRRERFEQNDYCSKNGKLLNNHELYKKFFEAMDRFNFDLEKVRGHQPSERKNEIEHIFTLVDKASRRALRNAK